MIVHLAADHWTVDEPDDCTRLHVTTALATPQDRAAALRKSRLGKLDGDDGHILLDLFLLHERAHAAATGSGWSHRWETMVEYARTKGWVTDDGTFVRAHIQPPSEN